MNITQGGLSEVKPNEGVHWTISWIRYTPASLNTAILECPCIWVSSDKTNLDFSMFGNTTNNTRVAVSNEAGILGYIFFKSS